MFTTRGAWFKAIATLTIPFLALAFFIALGANDRVREAQAASDDLDGIYPFASVAAIEGSLHEEGALAIALAVGLIEIDEFTTATAATDEARAELVDEITYHEPDSPLGGALIEIETAMASIEQTRSELAAGTFEGAASEPYRELLGLTRAATVATMPVLTAPALGAAPLANLDAARSASGEAVFESTASIFEESGTEPVSDALARLAAADLMLHETGPAEVVETIDEALATPEATLAAEGTELIANGEIPDLLAWADASVPWVLAYGDAETAAIEASSGSMSLRAERAEDAAIEFIIVAVAAWIALFIVSLLVARSIFDGQIEAGDLLNAAPVPTEEATLVSA
jgi:hypothetical protein